MSVENSWLYTQEELDNSPSITQMMENLLEVENLLDLENSLLYTQDGLNNSPSITNPSWMMENLLEVENLLDDGYEVLGNILRETCEYEQKIANLDNRAGDADSWFGLRNLDEISANHVPGPSQAFIPSQARSQENSASQQPSGPHTSQTRSQDDQTRDIIAENAPQKPDSIREAKRHNVVALVHPKPRTAEADILERPNVNDSWQNVAEDELRFLDQYYKENALRPVQSGEPGRLPYRHDPLNKYEQYKNEWKRLGLSKKENDQRRMSLRWRIRTLMCERDLPQLRLLDRDSLLPPEPRQQWKP